MSKKHLIDLCNEALKEVNKIDSKFLRLFSDKIMEDGGINSVMNGASINSDIHNITEKLGINSDIMDQIIFTATLTRTLLDNIKHLRGLIYHLLNFIYAISKDEEEHE